MSTPERIVVALGGNAISPAHSEDDIPHQFATTRQTAERLTDLVAAGHRLVVTHGNGPQVGNVLRRVELAAHELYTLPLEICVADTQAGMGYMIAQCLTNALRHHRIDMPCCALVTCVEVDPRDPAFANPDKPIGRRYNAAKARELRDRYGWSMVEVAPGQWRRVVPSPRPRRILEIDAIRTLSDAGVLLVAAGGGGIPVTRNGQGDLTGIEAVIDKDRTAALLARELGATTLLIATDVEAVALDFGTPTQRWLRELTPAEARRLLAEGHFAAGSMGPKVEAAASFVENGPPGVRAIICHLDRMTDALAGRGGTVLRAAERAAPPA